MKQVKLIEKKEVKEGVIEIPVESTINLMEKLPDNHIEIRSGGKFRNKAIYLPMYIDSTRVDWVMGTDDVGVAILIPVKHGLFSIKDA